MFASPKNYPSDMKTALLEDEKSKENSIETEMEACWAMILITDVSFP